LRNRLPWPRNRLPWLRNRLPWLRRSQPVGDGVGQHNPLPPRLRLNRLPRKHPKPFRKRKSHPPRVPKKHRIPRSLQAEDAAVPEVHAEIGLSQSRRASPPRWSNPKPSPSRRNRPLRRLLRRENPQRERNLPDRDADGVRAVAVEAKSPRPRWKRSSHPRRTRKTRNYRTWKMLPIPLARRRRMKKSDRAPPSTMTTKSWTIYRTGMFPRGKS
jgi:hypothetical protein